LQILLKDLFKNPGIIKSANDEYLDRVGADFEYYPLLGDRKATFRLSQLVLNYFIQLQLKAFQEN
jgi:hypothetical protein